MDGSSTGAAIESTPPSPASPSCTSTPIDGFNPSMHSWILVPEPNEALTGSTETNPLPPDAPPTAEPPTAGEEDVGEAVSSSAASDNTSPPFSPPLSPVLPTTRPNPPLPAPVLPPPVMSNSLLEEGEAVAALMISEILCGAWPTCTSALPSPSIASPARLRRAASGGSDRIVSSPTELVRSGSGSSEEQWVRAPSYGECAHEPGCTPLDDDARNAHCKSPAWARYIGAQPLAIVAVLIASHAAAFLLGLAVGRGGPSTERRSAPDCMLARRFSSGPYGYHARMCLPA